MANGNTLEIDTTGRRVLIGGRPVDVRLSRQEFGLLAYLYERRGESVPRADLLGHIWGAVQVGDRAPGGYDDHTLHALMHRLRTKFRRAGVDLNQYVTSVPGTGYRLDTEPAGEVAPEPRAASRFALAAAAGGAAALTAVAAVLIALIAGGGGGSGEGAPTATSQVGAANTAPTDGMELCGAEMTSPEPGSTLSGATVTFEWTAGCGMTKYDIWVGCSPGDDTFLNPDDGVFLSATAESMPLDGGPIYVKLTSSNGTDEGGFFQHLTYAAAKAEGGGTAVFVPGTATWLDTGIDVTQGQALAISACGQVSLNSLDTHTSKADGEADCPGVYRFDFAAPDAPCWSLIGRIGGGAPFVVGASFAGTAPASGRLELGINDDNVTDNDGGFRATVLTQ